MMGRRWRDRIANGVQSGFALLLIGGLASALGCSREEAPTAQAPAAPATPAAPAAPPAPAAQPTQVASDDLKNLVAPIALYPDPVLELTLQGSTQPGQVALAVRFLDRYAKDSSLKPDESWDTAIIGLLNYPRVLGMMNDSLEWTTSVGEAVAYQTDDVQQAVQELRWSAYNLGILASNEWQDVVVNGGVVAILPAQREQVSIPEYDGAALVQATEPAAPAAAPAAAGAPAPAPAAPAGGFAEPMQAAAPVAAVPVSYGQPQSSFWSNAAIFAGGAAVGGLLGYIIGDSGDDDDDDDDHYYGGYPGWNQWDDDWDNRPWSGGHNNVNIEGNTIIRPARPGTSLRPSRPITRPVDRPGVGRPGQARPGQARPNLPAPVVGKPGSGFAGRPSTRPAARPARPGPAGVAPARPPVRRDTREVSVPRPANARPVAKQPAAPSRPTAKPARAPERGGELGKLDSAPKTRQASARGQTSRAKAKPAASAQAKRPSKQSSALKRPSSGGSSKRAASQGSRGKKSRKR